jgi:hypothetical protein
MAFVNTLIDAKKQRRENEKAQAEEKAQATAEKKGE